MDKTAQTELHRLFLIERLPEPLTPASSHLQIFDNYIANTRLRLRQIRDPYTNEWTRMLQQRFPVHAGEPLQKPAREQGLNLQPAPETSILAETKLAEIHLNEAEYAAFAQFEGREIRKNRYFHEFDRVVFAFDVFLGPLWGLNTARVDFDTREHLDGFVAPPFAIYEVTENPFFLGENLVARTFAEVQTEVARLGAAEPAVPDTPDE